VGRPPGLPPGDSIGAPRPAPGEAWALLLDVDGTLFEMSGHPGRIAADAHLHRLLGRLLARCDGALALVSGRSIADLDRIFHPRILAAAGQHGLERRDARGRVHRHDGASQLLRTALARLRRVEAARPGVLLEDKGASLAVHYRLAPAHGPAVERVTAEIARRLGPRFEMTPGKMVCELRPAGRDKGTAIAEFLREPPFRGRRPVFVGDDRTDEFGFALVNRRGGHTIKVGAEPSAAAWRLADAAAVRRWLASVARALR
jgi:trehalose 6-phosphate phosphatase